jgi:SAM-dependent methyltransferase
VAVTRADIEAEKHTRRQGEARRHALLVCGPAACLAELPATGSGQRDRRADGEDRHVFMERRQDVGLLGDEALERSSVVANCAMNRERGLTGSNGYSRELGTDVLAYLQARCAQTTGPVRWLDLCCGSGRALFEAADQLAAAGLGDRVELIGVDLVDYFAAAPRSMVRLQTASVTSWAPANGQQFDLITNVHGLHYVGDKLAVLSRAASWLVGTGSFVASFDVASIRRADHTPMGRPLLAALRQAGFSYDARSRRIACGGDVRPGLPFSYLGADDTAGPNYTGQPAGRALAVPAHSLTSTFTDQRRN